MFIVDISNGESIDSVLLDQKPWWRNFCDHCDEVYNVMNGRAGEPFITYSMVMVSELAKYNCVDRQGTMLLDFETESDAMVFILKFS